MWPILWLWLEVATTPWTMWLSLVSPAISQMVSAGFLCNCIFLSCPAGSTLFMPPPFSVGVPSGFLTDRS